MMKYNICLFVCLVISLFLGFASAVNWIVNGEPGRTVDYITQAILCTGFLAIIEARHNEVNIKL